MNIWIKSADKTELIKLDRVRVEHCEETRINVEANFVVINDKLFEEYKTKERCLEILNEIQSLLFPKPILNVSIPGAPDKKTIKKIKNDLEVFNKVSSLQDTQIIPIQNIIYEMPEE